MLNTEEDQQGPAVPAPEPLASTTNQLVTYLERIAGINNSELGLDIMEPNGVSHLSRDQRTQLASKVRDALPRIENERLQEPFEINGLLGRLRDLANKIADGHDSSSSRNRRVSASSTSTESTQPDIGSNWKNRVNSAYRELVADGGRPTCSVEHLAYIIANPTADRGAVAPWLNDYPNTEYSKGRLFRVLDEQLNRWLAFRKSQWINRGSTNGYEGLEAYFKAYSAQYEGDAAGTMRSKQFYRALEKEARELYENIPVERQVPDQGFSAYSAAVKRRLAMYGFRRPIQLMEDPRQQTRWTDWLEYLSYEQWCLEELIASVQDLDDAYTQATDELCELISHNRDTYLWDRRAQTYANPAEELHVLRAALENTHRMTESVLTKTDAYIDAESSIRFRRNRVDWIAKEASAMDAELAQEDDSRLNANKKRRHGEEDKETSKPSKRPKRGGGTASTTASEPKLRRSTRLAQKKATSK